MFSIYPLHNQPKIVSKKNTRHVYRDYLLKCRKKPEYEATHISLGEFSFSLNCIF